MRVRRLTDLPETRKMHGIIDADGNYVIGSYSKKDGLPFVRLYEHPSVAENCLQKDYSRDGAGDTDLGPLFMDPFPLDEHRFLVSHNPDKKWNTVDGYALCRNYRFMKKVAGTIRCVARRVVPAPILHAGSRSPGRSVPMSRKILRFFRQSVDLPCRHMNRQGTNLDGVNFVSSRKGDPRSTLDVSV